MAGAQPKNYGGLAFAFTGDDSKVAPVLRRMREGVRGVYEGFRGLQNGLTGVGQKVQQRVKEMSDRVRGSLGGMARAVDSVVDRAMSADTGYDSSVAEFRKQFAAMTVGMTISEKELDRWGSTIVSVGHRTGESMEGMAKGFAEARSQGLDMEAALGVRGASGTMTRLAKISSVFGIESQKLVQTYALLKGTFKVNEEQARRMGDRIFVTGKQFGIGREAIQQWPELIGELSKQFADLGRTASPQEVGRIAESVVTLGGALSAGLGKPAEESLGLARQIFTVLAGEKRGILDMFRGMGGEIGRLGMQIAETGGSVDEMFSLISTDPMKFMEGLQRMAKQSEFAGGRMGVQFQRLSKTVTDTLGPDVTNLLRGNWTQVQAQLKQLPGALAKSTDALGKAAEASHKFVGQGDPMQQMVEGFHRRVVGLTRVEYRQWFSNLRTGFKETGDILSDLAHKEGPVGSLTKRLLLVQRVGLSGLFTQTSEGAGGAGKALGVLATQATGALGAMSKLGIRLSDLPALIGVGGPVLLGMAAFDKGLRGDIVGAVGDAAEWLFTHGRTMFKDSGKGLVGGLLDGLQDDLDSVMSFVPMIEVGLSDMIGSVNWDKVGGSIGGWLVKGAGVVGHVLENAFLGIWDEVFGGERATTTLGGAIGQAFARAGKGALRALGRALWDDEKGLAENLTGLGAIVGKALIVGLLFSSTVRTLFFAGFKRLFSGATIGGVTRFAGAAARGVGLALYRGLGVEKAVGAFVKVGQAAGRTLAAIGVKARATAAGVGQKFAAMGRSMGEKFPRIRAAAQSAFGAIGRGASAVGQKGKSAFKGMGMAASAAAKVAKKAWASVKQNAGQNFMALLGVVAFCAAEMKEESREVAAEWRKGGMTMGRGVKVGLQYGLTAALKFTDTLTGGVIGDIVGGWGNMTERMGIYWDGFVLMAEDLADSAGSTISETWGDVWHWMKTTTLSAGMWIGAAFRDKIINPIRIGLAEVKLFGARAFLGLVRAFNDAGAMMGRIWHGVIGGITSVIGDFLRKIPGVSSVFEDELKKLDDFSRKSLERSQQTRQKSAMEAALEARIAGYETDLGNARSDSGAGMRSRASMLGQMDQDRQEARAAQGAANQASRAAIEKRKLELDEKLRAAEAKGKKQEADRLRKERDGLDLGTPAGAGRPDDIYDDVRPSKKPGTLPQVSVPAGRQDVAQMQAQMDTMMASVNQQMALFRQTAQDLANRPMYGVVNMDGRRTGDVIFRGEYGRYGQTFGNQSTPR